MESLERIFYEVLKKYRALRRALGEILYGMTVHELDLELRREKRALEDLLFLAMFGDMVGLPLFPPYFSLRLLPYSIASLESWKRSLLRGKDLSELVGRE